MPAGFHRHLVGKTLINVCYCESVISLNTLCWQVDGTDVFLNQWIEFYLNNTIHLRPLTTHYVIYHTHKMAIESWP